MRAIVITFSHYITQTVTSKQDTDLLLFPMCVQCQRRVRMCHASVLHSNRWRVASYLSLERYNFPVHRFKHRFALIDQPGLRRLAGLRAGGHGDEIIVIDVNAARQPVLVPLLFRAGPAAPRRAAQRSHRARASVTVPPMFKQRSSLINPGLPS